MAGGKGIAFAAPAADCTSTETEALSTEEFKDNKANSVEIGLVAL